MNCTFTIYAPTMFSKLIAKHFREIDFSEALKISTNALKIKKLSEKTSNGEEVKSGEIFFLTKDRTLILKTTNEQESKVFLNMLSDYSKNFDIFLNSQIGKIFGLFDVNFEDAGKSIKLFIMEALDPINEAETLRKYDLKGSTSDRKVLSHFDSYDLSLPIGCAKGQPFYLALKMNYAKRDCMY